MKLKPFSYFLAASIAANPSAQAAIIQSARAK